MMRVSRFVGGAKDNSPQGIATTWENLVADVIAPGDAAAGIPPGQHMIIPPGEKENTPAWSPCEFRAGGTRNKSDAIRVHAFVVDFDGGTAEEIGGLCQRYNVKKKRDLPPAALPELRKIAETNFQKLAASLQGLAYYAHTSFSHGTDEKPIALRVVVRLTRPIEASEWPKFWRLANAKFAGLCDPATKDVCRLFFCAAMPAGSSEQTQHVVSVGNGEPLDVDRLLGSENNASAIADSATDDFNARMMALIGADTEQGRMISLEEVNEFAHVVARSKSPKKAEVGKRLRKMCAGERFAHVGAQDSFGGVDNAIVRMCYMLCEQFPDAQPRSLAEHFKRSLDLQFREDGEGHTVDDVHSKLTRFMGETRTRIAERDAQVAAARAVRIREAFGTDRTEGYTPEELTAFGDMTHRWVIQYGSNYYVFFDGDYRTAVPEKSLIAAIARDLAPAYTANVEIYKRRETGEIIPKTPQEIVMEYGSVAHEVHVELGADRCHYDSARRVFVEAPCPLRVTTPEFVPEVDQWLKKIGNDRLPQWIALVTRLDRPCSALYLDGVKASGKSLLAEGLARLWTTGGCTQAVHALGGTWNEDLTRCALVFADEALPPKLRASGYTGELREAIQNTRRPLVRKYKPNAVMIGAIRLILAANNSSLLETQEALTPNDIAAISDRFLYVHMPQAAADYLESIGGRKRVHEIFVERDGLAKHALWLRENSIVADAGRFFFAKGSEEIARSLTTSSGIRGSICAWLCMYLLDPAPVDMLQTNSAHGKLVFVENGGLYIAPAALAHFWQAYKTNRQPPSPGQAGTALRGLSTSEGAVTKTNAGREATFYHIDSANLETWAADTGYCSREQIKRGLVSKVKGIAEASA